MEFKAKLFDIYKVVKLAFLHKKTILPLSICATIVLIHILIPFDIIFEKGLIEKKSIFQKEINSFEETIQKELNENQFNRLDFNSISKTDLEKLNQNYYTIQKYENNSNELVFWSKKSVQLTKEQLLESKNKVVLMNIYNSYYLVSTRVLSKYTKVGLLNIDEYLVENWNRRIQFFDQDKEFAEFQVLAYPVNKNEFSLTDSKGKFLFSIQKIVKNSDIKILISIILYFIEILFFLLALGHMAKRISEKYNLIGIFFVIFVITNLRKLFLFFKFPSFLYSLKLFNPTLFSTSLNPSLGDFLIFLFLFQYCILFINKNLKFDINRLTKYKIGFLIHTLVLLFFLGESFSMSAIFERLVLDSSIWFNFNYFPKITIYSLIGLTVMLMSLSNYYILMKFAVNSISKFNFSFKKRLLSFALVISVLVGSLILGNFKSEINTLAFILFFFMSIVYIRSLNSIKNNYLSIFIFILFASCTTTVLLNLNNRKKEELIYSSIASNIAFGNDDNVKKQLIDFAKYYTTFKNTSYIDSNFKELLNYRKLSLLEYQNQYYKILNRNQNESKTLVYSDANSQIHYIDDINNKKYILETPSEYFEFYPNNYLNKSKTNLKNSIGNIIIGESNINYALYIKDSLSEYSGQYPYLLHFNYSVKDGKTIEINENKYFSNRVYLFPNNIKVLVTSYISKPVSNFTLFSYIFCFNLILFFIYQILVFISNLFYLKNIRAKSFLSISLSEKIMLMMLSLIIAIFLSIAVLSYKNLESKSEEYNKEYLTNKLNSIQFSLQSSIKSNDFLLDKNKLFDYINQLSKYNNVDIVLYDIKGKLLTSSNDDNINLFSKLSELDPITYWTILNENIKYTKYSTDFKKNNYLEATSIVFPFENKENYIISIPLTSNNKMKSDISNFTVALLNLYIFLFFISLILSIWLANNITNPLKKLTNKITKIQFSKKNEYLEYKYNDEIGELVKKYNTMVDEIEYSAKQMAFNEREAAWREMAMQIAHEIKNPLTPMKLKIQYLRKKIMDQSDGIEELTLKVSETLIEQINNLDMIATSFSNFARINEPKIEKVDLLLLTKNVTSVFDNKTSEIVEFECELPHAFVLCDHTQMVSCLNNLIKNAFQALSEKEIKKVFVRLKEKEGLYILEVKDYGVGMNENTIEKIFSPKFTTKTSGSGLGLSITKKFLDSIGASIHVDSKLNEYTIFTISIAKYESDK